MIAALGWPISELIQPYSLSRMTLNFLSYVFLGKVASNVDISNQLGNQHPSIISGVLFKEVLFVMFLI